MSDLDLTTLRLFVDVCESKNIKRVAEREKVDPSAITKRLAKLEAQLGTTLLRRIKQGVQPTPEGLLLSEYAKKIVLDSEKIFQQIKRKNIGYSGSITIASSSSNVGAVLTDDLGSFMSLSEQANVQMVIKEMMVSKDVVQAVRDGVASIGIIWDNTETIDLQSIQYTADPLAVVVPRGHSLSNHAQVNYEEIVTYEMVATKNIKHTEALLKRSGGLNSELPSLRIKVEVDTWESALKLVGHGVGLLVCSAKFARQYADLWKLVVIPISDVWAHRQIKICYKSKLQTPLAERLIKHLIFQHQK